MNFFKKLGFRKQTEFTLYRGEKYTEEHADYLKKLVAKADQLDKKREVFGSGTHQYKLKPVVAFEKVLVFQQKHKVTLPEEYVFFLTKVGNGGAGPYYGVHPLEKLADRHESPETIGASAFITKELTKESWNQKIDQMEEADDDEYDCLTGEISSGLLNLGTQGCTYDNLLLLNGTGVGEMVYIDWNLFLDYPPYFTGLSFLEWYQQFFEELIAGNNVNSYGYIPLGTEEFLMESYEAALPEKRKDWLVSFYRFSKVKPETIEWLKISDDPELDAVRGNLLFQLEPQTGIAWFKELVKKNPQAAIDCARSLPQDQKNNYYETMLKLLYEPDLNEKDRILFFLKDCTCLQGKDILEFANDSKQEENTRRTAIWVMGEAKDSRHHLAYFIQWMREDSYWIAHAALQAVPNEKNNELLETYQWMWQKYAEDDTMKSNLTRAFQLIDAAPLTDSGRKQ